MKKYFSIFLIMLVCMIGICNVSFAGFNERKPPSNSATQTGLGHFNAGKGAATPADNSNTSVGSLSHQFNVAGLDYPSGTSSSSPSSSSSSSPSNPNPPPSIDDIILTLRIKYQDTNGRELKPDLIRIGELDFGDYFDLKPWAPNPLVVGDKVYDYLKRDDNKQSISDPIGPLNRRVTIVTLTYNSTPTYQVTIKHQYENNNPVPDMADAKISLKSGQTYTPNINDIPNNTPAGEQYRYNGRSDNKNQFDEIGPIVKDTEVIAKYLHVVRIRYGYIDDNNVFHDLKTEKIVKTLPAYGDHRTEEPIINGQKINEIKNTDGTYRLIAAERYGNSGNSGISKDGVVVKNEGNDVEVRFIYKLKPTIDGSVESPDFIPTPDENNNPNNPNNPNSPYYGSNIIVLDEVFGIKSKITNVGSAENGSEVRIKFPFDVYYNGEFRKANSELTIDTKTESGLQENKTYYFRLPSWIIEQSYKEQTILRIVNSRGEEYDSEKLNIAVIGRLYDFTITNIEGDQMWQTSLFGGNNAGKEYKADTLPIGENMVKSNVSTLPVQSNISTQNNAYKFGMKLGTTFLFSVNTKGLKSNSIKITPMLEYYDKDGKQIKNATYTYNVMGKGEQPFANSNGVITATINNFSTTLNKSTRNTTEVSAEIMKAIQLRSLNNILNSSNNLYANVTNAYKNFESGTLRSFGGYASLLLPNTLRVPYANYASALLNKAEAHRIGNTFQGNDYTKYSFTAPRTLNYITNNISEYYGKTRSVSIDENAIINSLSHWYAEYRLPASLKVKSSDGKTIYNNGYVVVRFKIESLDASGYTYLTYPVAQWNKENSAINANQVKVNFPTTLYKSSFTGDIGVSNSYYPVAIFEVGQRVNDNFETEGTH